MGDDELAATFNRLGLSDEKVFRIRSGRFYMQMPSGKDYLDTDGSDDCDSDSSSDEEDEMVERRRELMECRREGRRRGLERSNSADLVLLRAADGPHDNRFLYVYVGASGELKLKMGFVNPREGGKGVFKLRKMLDEVTLSPVYSYTNLHFNKSIGVQSGPGFSISLMEPPQSPVSTSDPRMFRKPKEPYQSFRLESVPFKDCSITYNNAGDVNLTKRGSAFTERNGNPSHEIDSLKPLRALSAAHHEGIPPTIVAEYAHHRN